MGKQSRAYDFGIKSLYRQGGSLMIVIPSMWAKLCGVKFGDKVNVRIGSDGELVVEPID